MGASKPIRVAMFAAMLAIFAAGAAPAALATTIAIQGAVRYDAGVVPIAVTADAGISSVTLDIQRAGHEAEHVSVSEQTPHVFGYDLALREDTTVVAHGFAGATETWSGTLVLKRASFAPARVTLSLPQKSESHPRRGKVISADETFTGTCDVRTTGMTVQRRRSGHWVNVWSGAVTPDAGGNFKLTDITMPSGRSWMRVVARNGFGSKAATGRIVYRLGVLPQYKKLVLVDQSALRLWVIRDHVVVRTSRCAAGMPWTPTPNGRFRLGNRHRTPNAVWGPWRLRLWRRSVSGGRVVYRATSYYIHGTNRPSSIGHYASHGCIRLPNPTIRMLSTYINGDQVLIRE